MSKSLDLDLLVSSMKDPDVNVLVSQNKSLAAELAQCQADKDFVWSLWKKLQVSNPDVTEAISLVTQREKEKSETKDRKVLEIIQVKDDRIEELQNIVTKQAEEISDVLSKKVELTEKNSRLQLENDRLMEKVHVLEVQTRSEESREKSLEDTFRRTVEGTEKEKYELGRQVAKLTSEVEMSNSEKIHAVNRQRILQERIHTLEKEVSEKMVKFEELVREVEDSSSRLTRYESQTSQQRRDLDFKNQELENVRKELRELWTAHNQLTEHSGQQADLIRQLQSLQQDTQKMLKNQEDAFTLESTSLQQMFTDVNTRYEMAKRTEADLRQQVLELKKSLMDKDDIISSLHSQESVEHSSKQNRMNSESQPEYTGSFLDIVQEVDSIDARATPTRKPRGRSLNRCDAERRINISLDVTRSRSLSPPTQDVEPRLELSDSRKLAQLQKSLELKTCQLEEMRRAHDNRLHRLENLQASYRLAREELKAAEFGRKPKAKKPKRADPRSLQKENSDQVWNELSFFKAENRTLQIDKMSLQEEVDLLRVQTSQDAATVHELKVASQGQKEEFEFQMRRLNRESRDVRDTEKQLSYLRSQVQSKGVHIEKLERDMENAISQRDDLAQEKSKLMSQLVSTQQEASRYRMELADIKHQLQSAKHELEELRLASIQAESEEDNRNFSQKHESEVVNAVALGLMAKKEKRDKNIKSKKYPKTVSGKGGEETNESDDFLDEEWEELPDSGASESESESPSLGKTIVRHSRPRGGRSGKTATDKNGKKVKPRRVPTHRPPTTKSNPQLPDNDRSSHQQTSPRRINPSENVPKREFATSPIAFLTSSTSPSMSLQAPAAPQQRTTISVSRPVRRSSDIKQMASLRQRISHLQQQVAILKKTKMAAVQSEETLRETVTKLQTELVSVNGRLKAAKQNVQKLQTDAEKFQKEKQEGESSTHGPKSDGKMESAGEGQEVKVLEARLKVASSEVSRQAASLRNLKTENEGLQEQVRNLQDRINHLERDVNQKRNLLESQRIKLKHAQDISKSDADNVEELQTKIKLLTDTNSKMKVQLDSLKKRLSLVTKDKKEYEEKFIKASLELEHKTKQLQESSSRRANLESALTDLEKSAQQQLHGLATQSEAAIDAAREKLTAAQTRLSQFHSMIKILATELVTRAERARSKMKEARVVQERSQREGDPSLKKAQNKAMDILNLSHSDLEDIMSADGEGDSQDSVSGDERKSDKRWLRKCEKLMSSRDDFVHPLVSLFLQKMDERADLLIKLSL